jgi:hypothetical protein
MLGLRTTAAAHLLHAANSIPKHSLTVPANHVYTPQAVESCLMSNLAEHMNAEIVLGTIKDVPGAIQWIKSSFLFKRVRSNPQHYG